MAIRHSPNVRACDSACASCLQVIKCNPSTSSAWTKKKQPKVCFPRRSLQGCDAGSEAYINLNRDWVMKAVCGFEAIPLS